VLAATAAPVATAQTGVDQGAPDYYDSGLAPTPYMGWNTYYGLGAPTEQQVRSVADKLVNSGLRDAGYDIVWLDGGWQADNPRDADGRLVANPDRFPSGIPALVSYLHQRGLKAGIYTDAGTYDGGKSCGLGSRGHYDADARQFAAWKIDAVKVDFLCGIGAKLDPGPAFKEFSDAVAKSGRKMLLNLCNPLTDDWGLPHTPEQDAHNTYVYAPTIADSWRTGTDIAWGTPSPGQWPNILRNMDANAWHPEAQGPGHYNDPDYLIPMRQISDGSLELSQEESTTQYVMWAEMASPLVLGSDPRTLSDSMLATLRNPEIIGVDQDPLAIQGVRVASDSVGDVYSKVLVGHARRAVVLLNRSDQPALRTVQFADVGLGGPVQVRDLRARADRGAHTGSYTVEVPAHGTAFLKLTGADALPGTNLGAKATASPAVVRDGDTLTTFLRGPHGSLVQHTDAGVRDLGGPTKGGRRPDRRLRARHRLPGLSAGLRRRSLGCVAGPGWSGGRCAVGGVHRLRELDAVRHRLRRAGRTARPVVRLDLARRTRRQAGVRPPVRRRRRPGSGSCGRAHRGRRRVDADPGNVGGVVAVDVGRRDRRRESDAGRRRGRRGAVRAGRRLHALAAAVRERCLAGLDQATGVPQRGVRRCARCGGRAGRDG
jgi:alpha-galactosidase